MKTTCKFCSKEEKNTSFIKKSRKRKKIQNPLKDCEKAFKDA